QPGSNPPGVDFDIGAREVRGEMSSGMLCSAAELGLEDESEGLLILDERAEPGRPAFEALGLDDTVIEIDLTPNRPDCLGHVGVAREVAALFERELTGPDHWKRDPLWEEGDGSAATDAAGLAVEDDEGCPRYLFAVVEDIEVGPSPSWLEARLAAVGLRSVNNVVDLTNYVLLDVNQPLHAFDLDELNGPEIRVRRADKGESLVGIDHVEYELDPQDLVIADAERPVAIAGVMGGEETEVGPSTSRILIECAYFEPTTVRKSARRHNLHTDSSHRFERGIDPGGLPDALAHAVQLIVDEQTERGADPTVRIGVAEAASEGVAEPTTIQLEKAQSARVLGAEIDDARVADYLERIGVQLEDDGDERWGCTVPTYRPDLTRPIDLVEEVARLYGYDRIPETLPEAPMGDLHRRQQGADQPQTIVERIDRELVDRIRTQLLSYGAREVVNYGFMSFDDLDVLRIPDDDPRRDAVALANPLVASQRYMQTTLLPGLIENLKTNLAHRMEDVALFEIGRRYSPDTERETLAILLSGDKTRHWSEHRAWDFFDLKGLIEAIARPFRTDELTWRASEPLEPFLHPGVQAEWSGADGAVAQAGQLHPAVAAELEVEQAVYLAEIALDDLFELGRSPGGYEASSRYPAVRHDFALTYDRRRPYADLEEAIVELARTDEEFGSIFESHELFDVYAGEQVGEDQRSLALSIVYRSPEKTLVDADVERADQRLVEWLEERVGARLR
ncbi:MAG: phenylalanine--tRNA ligase subunit beta, partial [Persicimonas sp.]